MGPPVMADEPTVARLEQSADTDPHVAVTDDDVEEIEAGTAAAEGIEDASNARQVKEKKRRQQHINEERDMVIQSLLAVGPGQRFLSWMICDLMGVFGSSINSTLQPEFSMHREGQRAVGLVLQGECLRAAPRDYLTAIGNHLTQGSKK
jgi:hypothetical protein